MRGLGRLVVVSALLALAGTLASAAYGSQLLDRNATKVRLAVDKDGRAMVTYEANGRTRRVVVWGAVDARHPDPSSSQVRFRTDYSGGWGAFGKPLWKTFKNACRPYDGPALAWLAAACKAPDGSYWALQSWQPALPHRGVAPWLPSQSAWGLHISHWTTQLAKLDVWTDWIYGGEAHNLFGRLTYLGQPVHGFGTNRVGVPADAYGRSLYIDTHNSAYGPGWKRETSIVSRKPTGAFCYGFYPTRDVSLPGYPNNLRPAGHGERYRITVVGPGVTPDISSEDAGLPAFEPWNPSHTKHESAMNALLDSIVPPSDAICSAH